jgi:hypothetical protein
MRENVLAAHRARGIVSLRFPDSSEIVEMLRHLAGDSAGRVLFRLILESRAFTAMHDPVTENSYVGALVVGDRLTAAHAPGKHRVDRARELLDRRVGRAAANVHPLRIDGPDGRR